MLFAAPIPAPVLEAAKPCYVSVQSAPGSFAPESMSVSGPAMGRSLCQGKRWAVEPVRRGRLTGSAWPREPGGGIAT